jgi:preprotein translocase subunit SecG
MSFFLGLLLSLVAIFLVLLVLVQRGRGGGLAGALGGMGGSSAFGAKAGDVFTRITVVTAAIWILLCVASVKLLSDVDPADIGTTYGASAAPNPEGEATNRTSGNAPVTTPTPTDPAPGTPTQ